MMIKVGLDWIDLATVTAIRPCPAEKIAAVELPDRVYVDQRSGHIAIVNCQSYDDAVETADRIAEIVNKARVLAGQALRAAD